MMIRRAILAIVFCMVFGPATAEPPAVSLKLPPLKLQSPQRPGWNVEHRDSAGLTMRNFDNAHASVLLYNAEYGRDAVRLMADAHVQAQEIVHALPLMQVTEESYTPSLDFPYPCIRARLIAKMEDPFPNATEPKFAREFEYRVLVCGPIGAVPTHYVAGFMFVRDRAHPEREQEAEAFLRGVQVDR